MTKVGVPAALTMPAQSHCCESIRKFFLIATRATQVAARADKVSDHVVDMSHLAIEVHVHLLELFTLQVHRFIH